VLKADKALDPRPRPGVHAWKFPSTLSLDLSSSSGPVGLALLLFT
jgi:hypothetical protein